MEVLKLKAYLKSNGRAPFSKWMKELDKGILQIVRLRLARLRGGNFGDCTCLSSGIFELRIHCGAGYRIYFGLDGHEVVILLSGGSKRTQLSDIVKAKKYWSDYLQERNQGDLK